MKALFFDEPKKPVVSDIQSPSITPNEVMIRSRRVEMIKRWRRAELRRCGSHAGLMRGIVGGEQQVRLRQVLHMDEGVGRRQPRFDACPIGPHLAIW